MSDPVPAVTDSDVCVVGAGLVGASFALALAGTGLTIALVEPSPPAVPRADWDARIYALSPSAERFLRHIGVWADLVPERLQSVYRMRVFGDRDGEIGFSAYETGLERLATTVESGRLQHALWQRLDGASGVRLLEGMRPEALNLSDAGQVALTVAGTSGRTRVNTRLLVGADGANSWVRQAAAIDPIRSGFDQVGVVANLTVTSPHHGTAFQWFRPDGILAWLPLPGDRVSLVWSTSPEHGAELLQLGEEAFGERVAEAGRALLGSMRLEGQARSFPLESLSVPSSIAHRIALIGDAAHVVHPLAGQGVNLGFGDAETLAEALSRPGGVDPGDRLVLRRFERSRAEAILAMRFATSGLHGLFASPNPAVATFRNFGLNLTDRLPVLKTLIARAAAVG